jgi:predicted ATP-dependent serine protease
MQNSKMIGKCATCHRITALTKHHLIPKKKHKRKKRSTIDLRFEEVVYICRKCHDGIHDFYDENTLAEELNTLEKLQTDTRLEKHFKWVSKCKKGIR